jgi:hypothetical protein
MTELGCPLPSKEDLVASFLDKLPAKYDSMRAVWLNLKRLIGDSLPYQKTDAKAAANAKRSFTALACFRTDIVEAFATVFG